MCVVEHFGGCLTQGVWREDSLINWGSVKRKKKRNSKGHVIPCFLAVSSSRVTNEMFHSSSVRAVGADVSASYSSTLPAHAPGTRAGVCWQV